MRLLFGGSGPLFSECLNLGDAEGYGLLCHVFLHDLTSQNSEKCRIKFVATLGCFDHSGNKLVERLSSRFASELIVIYGIEGFVSIVAHGRLILIASTGALASGKA